MQIAQMRKVLIGAVCILLLLCVILFLHFEVKDSSASAETQARLPLAKEDESIARLTSRNYVLEVINTRKIHPSRPPSEWKKFVLELVAWYRDDRVDCTATLKSRQLDWVLRMVEESKTEASDEELFRIARECTSSATQLDCYRELWRRKSKGEPSECMEFVNSLPALVRPVFHDGLVELWVKKKGAAALPEMLKNREVPTAVFQSVFLEIVYKSPEEALQFLQNTESTVLVSRFGKKIDHYSLLISVCEKLPPARSIEILSQFPPSVVRDGRIAVATMRAVEESPSIAVKLISNDPNMIGPVAWAAPAVSKTNPLAAATILNAVPGEKLRTSVGRKVIMELPEKEGLKFIESISDALTRESIRKTYLLKYQPKPIEKKK